MKTTQHIESLKQQYLETLAAPLSTWTTEIKTLYIELNAHIFEDGYSAHHALETCGLRDHNVTLRFKRNVGLCPQQYLLYHRAELGKILLTQTAASITDIADELGYSSGTSHFSMMFKQHTGITPAQYRRNANAENL